MNSDDTVTIDGKNYLKSDIIRYCTPEPLRLLGEPVKYGDRFLIENQEYICARVGQNELQLIDLGSGNRWSDCRSKAEISGIATDLKMFEGANFADVSRVPTKRVTK